MTQTAPNLDLIHALVSFLPPAVARTIHADPRPLQAPRSERFAAAVLLADVSGFTALTGDLATLGAAGVEELTSLVNRYFSRMIDLLEASGGEVVQFSGDALIAVFAVATAAELPGATATALGVAEQMQAAMGEFTQLRTSLGERALAMKIALGAGEVLGMAVGGVESRWQYIIAGDPLRQVGAAEHSARRGEIVLSPQVRDLLGRAPARPRRRLPALDWAQAPTGTLEALCLHIPRAITARLISGQADWLADLRRISVVFLGVGGLDDLHPDAVRGFQTAMRVLQETTDRYEGSINKFQVDDKGVIGIVLFGAPPLAHPEDPLFAVRCALDLQQQASAQGLRLAVGITTGQVFAGPVGSPSRREYTVMGDAVNLAARLMQAAEAGDVLCDYATYRFARAELLWDELPPLILKGKAAPVRAYRPRGLASSDAARSARQDNDKPLVGRAVELGQLAGLLDAMQAGASQLLWIEGEGGIGKTRLTLELRRMVRERGVTGLLGSAQSLERETPYNAWREIIGAYFDLDQQPSRAARREQLLARLDQIAPELTERAPLLNDLLDLNLPESDLTAGLEPAQRQASLSALIVELLRLWASEQPLVLVFEDAHWLDPLSWELVGLLARALADLPLLLVLIQRPGPARPPDHPASALRTGGAQITLGPLGPGHSAKLAAGRLGVARLSDDLAQLVAQRAAGNPLVIEELALSLKELGAVVTEGQTAELRGDPSELHLPESLQSLVLSRIDHLPEAAQLTIKLAAVIGPSFERAALRAIYPLPIDGPQLELHLTTLIERELIVEASEGGPASHRFRQALLQEMTYSTVMPTQRRQLHAGVAAWYEAQPSEAQNSLLPQLAHHWRQSGNQAKELHYTSLAGRKFAAEYANAAALSYLSRALQLANAAAERAELLRLRLQVYERSGQRPAQRADLEQLDLLAARHGDELERARLDNAWAAYYRDLSDYALALAKLDAAEAVARRAGDAPSTARSLTLRGEVREIQGDFSAARECFARALEIYRTIGYQRGEANNLSRLGNLHYYQGEYGLARDLFVQALALRRAIHDASESDTLNNLGEAALKLGDWQTARSYWEQALAAARRVGSRSMEALVLGQLGYLALARAEYATARDQLSRSVQIFQVLGDRRHEAHALNDLGMLQRDIGDEPAARRSFEQALASQLAIGDTPNATFTALNLGRLLVDSAPVAAAAHYQRALDYACESGEREAEAYARSYIAHLAEHTAHWAKAEAGYRAALALRAQLALPTAEDLAGLARIALARADLPAAEHHARACLAAIATDGIDGLEFPLLAYLSCYEALRAIETRRQGDKETRRQGDKEIGSQGELATAGAVIAAAYALLMERANAVDDPSIRAAMIEQVPLNRRVAEAYAQAR